MFMIEKSRAVTAKLGGGTIVQNVFGVVTKTPYTISLGADQHTLTEDHSQYLHLMGKGFNIGGPFTSTKRDFLADLAIVNDRQDYLGGTWTIAGPRVPSRFYQSSGVANYPPVPAPASSNELTLYGTSGISRTIPTNPLFQATQFIGELVQDVPELPSRSLWKKLSAKNAAGEFLNWEFGVKPTISDVQSFAEAGRKFDQRRAWLKANSGRKLRRRANLLHTVETTFSEVTEGLYPLLDHAPTSRNQVKVGITTTTCRDVWFSGCYSYYYAEPPTPSLANLSAIKKAYGLEITPDLVWNLTPWTWLADWKTNTGQVMANLSRLQSDSLIMRYGYVMCHTYTTREYSFPPYGRVSMTSEVKQRHVGNPYGFAVKPDAFSVEQWAILSALGLNRGGATRY